MSAALVFAVSAQAAEMKPKSSSDENAIRAAVESYVAAYNRGDAKAVADHWSDNADWVSPSGQRFQGRQAIEQEMEVLFAENKGVKIEVIDPTVRLISPDVALEEGTVRVIRADEPPATRPTSRSTPRKTASGSWRAFGKPACPRPQPHLQLKQLEWLVGEWVDESPDVVVEHQCRWSEDGHFLLGQFVVQWQGRPAMKGDLRIGWDPLTQQIKSWVFDSEGGYAEGFWTQVGDRWVVKMTGVRPDGEHRFRHQHLRALAPRPVPIQLGGPDRRWSSRSRIRQSGSSVSRRNRNPVSRCRKRCNRNNSKNRTDIMRGLRFSWLVMGVC